MTKKKKKERKLGPRQLKADIKAGNVLVSNSTIAYFTYTQSSV